MDEVYKALDVNLEEPLKTGEQVEFPHSYTQSRPCMLDLPGVPQSGSGDSLLPFNCASSPEQSEKKKKKTRRAGKVPRERWTFDSLFVL